MSKIKAFLTYEQLRTVVCACIFSKIDYCNALYYGIISQLISKLQSVQNSVARLLGKRSGSDFREHDYIRKGNWLRVKERIVFKICLLVHNCLHGNSPSSLKELLVRVSSSRTLMLSQYPYKSNFGNRSFSRIGPKIWNLLPQSIRLEINTTKFKKLLKTYLFDNYEHLEQKLHER